MVATITDMLIPRRPLAFEKKISSCCIEHINISLTNLRSYVRRIFTYVERSGELVGPRWKRLGYSFSDQFYMIKFLQVRDLCHKFLREVRRKKKELCVKRQNGETNCGKFR